MKALPTRMWKSKMYAALKKFLRMAGRERKSERRNKIEWNEV